LLVRWGESVCPIIYVIGQKRAGAGAVLHHKLNLHPIPGPHPHHQTFILLMSGRPTQHVPQRKRQKFSHHRELRNSYPHLTSLNRTVPTATGTEQRGPFSHTSSLLLTGRRQDVPQFLVATGQSIPHRTGCCTHRA
jgi:hypothetical protein